MLEMRNVEIENFAAHHLQWKDNSNRAIVIELEHVTDDYSPLQFGKSIAQLRDWNIILLLNSVPDLPLCLSAQPIGDPRSHTWRGIAADVIHAAAFYSIRKTQMLGYPEDNVIFLGLGCLGIVHSMLLDIHRVFTEVGWKKVSEVQAIRRSIPIGDLRSSLNKFFEAMQKHALEPPFAEELANHLTSFYGILILFLIRSALRSALQYSAHDFKTSAYQEGLDTFFRLGAGCPTYQPNMAVLEATKTTINETWPEDDAKDEKTLWLYAQYQRAGKLLSIPYGLQNTLAHNLEVSINRWLNH
ncbi:hypothetical protein ACLMJK_000932 [Lecanora helva]